MIRPHTLSHSLTYWKKLIVIDKLVDCCCSGAGRLAALPRFVLCVYGSVCVCVVPYTTTKSLRTWLLIRFLTACTTAAEIEGIFLGQISRSLASATVIHWLSFFHFLSSFELSAEVKKTVSSQLTTHTDSSLWHNVSRAAILLRLLLLFSCTSSALRTNW